MFDLTTTITFLATLGPTTEPIAPGFLAPWLETQTSIAPEIAFATLGATAPADVSLLALSDHGHACDNTALAARSASLAEARADYLFAIANCVMEGGSFGHCSRLALADYLEQRDEAYAVHRERRRVCELTDGGPYAPKIDPENFSPKIDNPFWPVVAGRKLVYRKVGEDGVERIRITVRPETIDIAGVECVVIRDVVHIDGELIEDTDDFYAQDSDGNVWYFGEVAQNFEDGLLDNLDGSWRHGVESAKAGILMPTNPQVGQTYRQEFLLDEAEDVATVISLGETVTVPAGTFANCLQTEDWTPIEPGVAERKFYAPGIGLVLEVDPRSGERLELVRIIE